MSWMPNNKYLDQYINLRIGIALDKYIIKAYKMYIWNDKIIQSSAQYHQSKEKPCDYNTGK